MAIAVVWPPFLIPIVLYGWVLPTAQAREITATFLMILVIVGDIAVLSLVTIMLLFAKGISPQRKRSLNPRGSHSPFVLSLSDHCAQHSIRSYRIANL